MQNRKSNNNYNFEYMCLALGKGANSFKHLFIPLCSLALINKQNDAKMKARRQNTLKFYALQIDHFEDAYFQ